MGLSYKHRKVRDLTRSDYLADTGRTEVDFDLLLAWVKERPDHPGYRWLFG